MVPSGTIFPNSEEGSHSDFFCFPPLISERRQLGVHLERGRMRNGEIRDFEHGVLVFQMVLS